MREREKLLMQEEAQLKKHLKSTTTELLQLVGSVLFRPSLSMPLFFSNLPFQFQLSAIRKLDFATYARFRQCCYYSFQITNSISTKFTLLVKTTAVGSFENFSMLLENGLTLKISVSKACELPLRISTKSLIIHGADDRILSKVHFTVARADELEIWFSQHEIKLKLIARLIEVLHVQVLCLNNSHGDTLTFHPSDSFSNIDLSSFSKLSHLYIRGNVNSDIFLTLTLKNLDLVLFSEGVNLDTETLNSYLQRPKTKSLHVSSYNQFKAEFDPVLFKNLPYFYLWSSEKHKRSRLSNIYLGLKQGRAFTVVIMEQLFLLTIFGDSDFRLISLTGNSVEELLEDAWKKLRERMELYF